MNHSSLYVSCDGQTYGPYNYSDIVNPETEIHNWIKVRSYRECFIKYEFDNNWLNIRNSVFAFIVQRDELIGVSLLLIPLVSSFMMIFSSTESVILPILTVISTIVLSAIEADKTKMGKIIGLDGKRGNGPLAWVLVQSFLWAVFYPWYLDNRRNFGKKPLGVYGILIMLFFLFACIVSNAKPTNQLNQFNDRPIIQTHSVVPEINNEVYVECIGNGFGMNCSVSHVYGTDIVSTCWRVKNTCNNGIIMSVNKCAIVNPSSKVGVIIPIEEFSNINRCDNTILTAIENIKVSKI